MSQLAKLVFIFGSFFPYLRISPLLLAIVCPPKPHELSSFALYKHDAHLVGTIILTSAEVMR